MQGSYDPILVTASYLVAVAASYTALELARRVSESRGRSALIWLACGSVSMGIGIWTMHFIGMLAFSLSMPFSYDIFITLLSLVVGIAASAFAIFVASRASQRISHVAISGLLLGGGIAAMHYTGMAAMRMNAAISYDTTLLVLSIVIAVAAACAAIWIIFTLSHSGRKNLHLLKTGAAMIMGVAICGMHYTGMAAARYTPLTGEAIISDLPSNNWLAVIVGGIALLVLGVTHLTIFFDYRISQERRQAEKADQKAVQLSTVLDESSNEIYMFDSESLHFVKINQGASENVGYTRDELAKMTPVDLKPDYSYKAFCELLKPLRQGDRNELLFESTHRRKDGSEYPVQVHLQLSELTDPPLFVAIITDISDRKNLEAQLLQAKKLESIGQLAAGIAHEINTPAQFVTDNTKFVKDAFADLLELNGKFTELLTAVKEDRVTPALIQKIEAGVETADVEYLADEGPAAIDQSLDGIDRISHIVRAMKEFSHPGSKNRQPADINKAITNTITVASNEWKYTADLETELGEDIPSISCYIQEISQVMLNLIVNAAHAIVESLGPDTAEKGTIRIATRRIGEQVEIKVSDSGCGIPEDIRDRIFDPFFTTKEVGKGTGQGLAMAFRTIVDDHGGELSVESEPGAGTTFVIRLPIDPEETTEKAA